MVYLRHLCLSCWDDYDLEEDKYSQGHDTSDEESLIFDMDDDYEAVITYTFCSWATMI